MLVVPGPRVGGGRVERILPPGAELTGGGIAGLPALEGTISPAVALMSCNADGSKRTWPRNLSMPISVLMRTVTSNSCPTAVSVGPSTVTVGFGGGPLEGTGGPAAAAG